MAGKGDKPRPLNKRKYNENYEKIKWSSNSRKPNKNIKGKLVFVYKPE